jgi:hypothetical protein
MASKTLTDEEWEYVDKEINRVLRRKLTMFTYLQNKGLIRDISFGTQKVTHWFYKDVPMPHVTTSFREKPEALAPVDSAEAKVFGFQQGIYLSKKTIAAARMGGQRDILLDQYLIKLEKMAEALETAVVLGTGHYLTTPDLAIKGLFNNASVNNLAANACGIGTDDNMTAIGDFVVTLPLAISAMRADKKYGPYDLVWTSGLDSQARKNYNATTFETEYDILKRQFEGIINFPPIVCDYIGEAAATLSTANQEFMLVEADASNFVYKQTLPLGKRKWSVEKEGDEAFGIEQEGIIQVKDPNSICTSTTLVTGTAY